MHLRDLLDLGQIERSDSWVVLPRRGPLSGILISVLEHHDLDKLIDAESDDELPSPSLVVRRHYSRAVYAPMPQLGVAFGMPATDDPPGGIGFEWLPAGRWQDETVTLEVAHVLLDGAPVWEVRYVSLSYLDGAGAVLPWPTPAHGGEVNEITAWEASFVELISELSDHT